MEKKCELQQTSVKTGMFYRKSMVSNTCTGDVVSINEFFDLSVVLFLTLFVVIVVLVYKIWSSVYN